MVSFNRIHNTDLIAFMAGAVVLLMLMHSEITEGAIQELFYKKTAVDIKMKKSQLVVCLEI